MRLMTNRRWTLALALAALFSMVGGARGGDEPAEDAASLLRKARVAESVENDVPKALDLYRRAVDAGGSPDASKDAALRLADLLELRGKKTEAFAVLDTITERYAARLDDAQKKKVHDAIARLLPAGSRARTPLGEIYVLPAPGASPAGGTSPLDAKILGLLSRLDDVSGTDRLQVENSIRQALDVVGKDALPTLERAMNSERLDKAQFAAKEYARIGGKDAVAGLEKTIREGDGFARGAALQAMRTGLGKGPEASPAVVAAVDRLMAPVKDDGQRRTLLNILSQHLSDENLLKRHEAGGPDAGFFLLVAVQRSMPAAIEKALSLAESAEPLPATLLETLSALAGGTVVGWTGDRPNVAPANPALDPAKRARILKLVTAKPATAASTATAASIAGTIFWTAPEPEAREAALTAWAYAVSSKDLALQACREILNFHVAPPAALFERPESASAYWSLFAPLYRSMRGWQMGTTMLAKPAQQGSLAFWTSLLDTLPSLSTEEQMTLLHTVDATPPKETGPRWIDVLSALPFQMGLPRWLPRAAGQSGDPRFLDIVRKEVLGRPEGSPLNDRQTHLLDGLEWFEAPGRLELTLTLLADEKIRTEPLKKALQDERESKQFWPSIRDALGRLPRNRGSALVEWAAGWLNQDLPPAEIDASWIDVFPKVAEATAGRSPPFWVARAIARSGDPGFIDLARRYALSTAGVDAAGNALIAALPEYHGPGRLEYALEALGKSVAGGYGRGWFLQVLREDYAAPAARERLIAMARDAAAPGSQYAIQRLVELRDSQTVLEIMEAQRTAKVPGVNEHRVALIDAAKTLHLKEAIPFLLREFQEGLSDNAAKAMDAIREYHERLERYSAWTKGEDGGRKDLAALLKDADPEIRRAAVLSIAALGDKEALPVLVKMAKEDADPSVRKAALDAVTRLSR